MHDPDTSNDKPTLGRLSRTGWVQVLWNVAGMLFLLLAIVGFLLPFMPGAIFVLAAAACFMRGSDKMRRWLTANKYVGKYLTRTKTEK